MKRSGRARRRGRSASDDDPHAGDLVTLNVGGDILSAQVIAEACRAEGLKVELLTTEMAAHPNTVGVEQQLLVRAEDVEKVRAILRRQQQAPG